MTTPKHSPLPWRDDEVSWGIVDADGKPVHLYGLPPKFTKQHANRKFIIASVNSRAALLAIKNRIDARLNNHLIEMKPDYDDSITGFNEAWDIVRDILKSAAAAAEEQAQ